ncbi:hypothetical protein RchiOBHm_Chr5g0027821 [Rosa chinensis]|uniref:Uncharacterized protein n=1 Tax=Rosa chinensis TaxID=74649 RepID=A0A2P6Q981_ROSCH|nr:hypothetical protein RchiOBHm_Chr5g0027821 [Rosa chinensis]
MGAKTGLLGLERHFAFYGAYHSNPANILIDYVCMAVTFHCSCFLPLHTFSLQSPIRVQQSWLCAMGTLRKEHQLLWTNLLKALLMGPYFVLRVVLQSTFGYEPYPGFHASVKEKIEADTKEWKVKNQKKLY